MGEPAKPTDDLDATRVYLRMQTPETQALAFIGNSRTKPSTIGNILVATDIVGTTLEQYATGRCAQRVTALFNALDYLFKGLLRGVITCALAYTHPKQLVIMRSLILSAFVIGATVIAGCGSSASTETAPAPEVAPLAVTAGTYVVDPSHSVLSFSVRHMGFSTVTGTFASSEGQITIPESGIAGMSATATVAVESISTNNDDRDGHLKSPDFFDAANHPTLTLVTKSITPTGPNTFDLVADLTMRGTTKEVTLAGEYFGTVVDPWGNQKIALSATGTVDRFDYGLSWNKLIETGELVVSREVDLDLQVQAALVADQGAE